MSSESHFCFWDYSSSNYLKKSTKVTNISSSILDSYIGKGAAVIVGQVLTDTSGYIHIASLNVIEVYLRVISKTEGAKYDSYNCQVLVADAKLGSVVFIHSVSPVSAYTSPTSSDNTDSLCQLVHIGWQTSDVTKFDLSGVSASNKKRYRMQFMGSYYPLQLTYKGEHYRAYSGSGYNTFVDLEIDTIASRMETTVDALAEDMIKEKKIASYSSYQNSDNIAPYYAALVADTTTDVDGLPVEFAPGSTCVVIEDSSLWILGNDKIWHEI